MKAFAAAIIVLAGLGLSSSPAGAHPLGNFTVNRYARVEVSGDLVRVYYVLDEAEIPAFQERRAVDADEDAFLEARVAQLASELELTVDGTLLPLETVDSSLDRPAGQGGLQTLRVAAIYTAEIPDAADGTEHRLTFTDGNEPDRVGWREIVTVARGDGRISATDAPQDDVSDELRDYPGDLLQAPLDLRSVAVTFVAGGSNVEAAPLPESSPPPARQGGVFASLITRQDVTPAVLVGLIGIALAVGAGHALLPGHGKTVMAAYLVGTKGRAVDAVLLGVIVSLMHTASVLVLGLLLFRVGRSTSIESYYPALTVASGVLASALGVWLMIGRWRRFKLWREVHDHDDHAADAPGVVPLDDHGRPIRAEQHEHQPHDQHEHQPHDQHEHEHHEHEHEHHEHEHEHHEHEHEHHEHHEHEHHEHEHHEHEHHEHEHHEHEHHEHEHEHEPVPTGGGIAALSRRVVAQRVRQGAQQVAAGGHHHHHGPGGHTHELPDDVAPLTRRGLILLATSGGVVPSPTAVVVIVSAFSLGRPALGLGLIAAFSVGLAATLTAVGLALVFGRQVVERRISTRSLELLPTLGALALVVLGVVLAIRGLTGTV